MFDLSNESKALRCNDCPIWSRLKRNGVITLRAVEGEMTCRRLTRREVARGAGEERHEFEFVTHEFLWEAPGLWNVGGAWNVRRGGRRAAVAGHTDKGFEIQAPLAERVFEDRPLELRPDCGQAGQGGRGRANEEPPVVLDTVGAEGVEWYFCHYWLHCWENWVWSGTRPGYAKDGAGLRRLQIPGREFGAGGAPGKRFFPEKDDGSKWGT
jgi:hypothetical protein